MTDRNDARKPRYLPPALPPAILGAIVLAVGALLIGSDWFYLIRYGVSILALITGVITLQHRLWWWALPLVPIAVLWNPAWPIDLPQSIWTGAHYLAGIVLLLVGALARVPDETPTRPRKPK